MIFFLLVFILGGDPVSAAVERLSPRPSDRVRLESFSAPMPEKMPPTLAAPLALNTGTTPSMDLPALPQMGSPPETPLPAAGPNSTDELETLAVTQEKQGPAAAGAQGFDGTLVGVDLSAQYQSLILAPQGAKNLSGLKRYKVLLVPGFMTGAFIKVSRALGHDPKPWHYFGPQMRWLEEQGVEYELVAVLTEQTTAHNARIIRKAIDSSKKEVLLITHSKGGLDTLAAMLQLQKRRGLEKVRGWISVQSPFLGAPGADRVAGNRLLHFWTTRFLEHSYVGGSRHSITRMTTEASQRYNRRHAAAITELLRSVPTIAFTSFRQAGILDVIKEMAGLGLSLNPILHPSILWSPLSGLALILKCASGTLAWLTPKSDGLVPAARARLPPMDYVEVAGVDHLGPFVDHGDAFDRVKFTQTLLAMLLKRIKAKPR